MKLQLNDQDARLYGKLFVSRNDIGFARYCASVLLKKGWHSQSWERRGTVYLQQAVYTTALVTSYGRAFTKSRGWSKLPAELLAIYNDNELALHGQLMTLRHEVYAHSDSSKYTVEPWRVGDFSTDIFGGPTMRITATDATTFLTMTDKIMIELMGRISKIRASAPSNFLENKV